MFDLSEVGYVKRIVVGSTDPERLLPESRIQAQMDLVNRCLVDSPKGKILGIERGFTLINIGEHQVVMQSLTYHIGFQRKPYWLDSA